MDSMIFSDCSSSTTARLLPFRCQKIRHSCNCNSLPFFHRVSFPLAFSKPFLSNLHLQCTSSSTFVSAKMEMATESSAIVIDGKHVAKQIMEEIGVEIARMKESIGIVPGLAVILVGDRKDDTVAYVCSKQACEEVGINFLEVCLPENSTEQEVLNSITLFNEDPSVHGILVPLPLPSISNF